jgi:hypothetical protein
MALDLSLPIDRVENITRAEFQRKYMRPQKPVIIKHLYGKDAPIYNKWSFEYFQQELGDIEVGVYDVEGKERKDDRSYKKAEDTMNFGDYLDMIQKGETTRRLFLFNVFKHKKELRDDFHFPDIADYVIRQLPLAFFGGKNAVTRIHQDMDMSNVFLTEVVGKKRVVLFSPEYSRLLHRYPFGVHTSVDINNPDYNKFPGLKKVKGYDFEIEAGDTLFMPSGYWHHIEYLQPSIGVSVRSLAPTLRMRVQGLANVGLLTHIDEMLRWGMGEKWFAIKKRIADKRAEEALHA